MEAYHDPGYCNGWTILYDAWTYTAHDDTCYFFENCDVKSPCNGCSSGTVGCPSKTNDKSFKFSKYIK